VRRICQLPLIAALTALGAIGCNPPEQSQDCRQYVACQIGWDEANGHRAKDTTDYRRDGRCWESEPTAAQCTLECGEGLAALRGAAAAAHFELEACRD
jgi:hypothetical protein